MSNFPRLRSLVLMAPKNHISYSSVTVTEYEDRQGQYIVEASRSIPQGPMDDKTYHNSFSVRDIDHVWRVVGDMCRSSGLASRCIEPGTETGAQPRDLLSLDWQDGDTPSGNGFLLRYPTTPRPKLSDFPATMPGWYYDYKMHITFSGIVTFRVFGFDIPAGQVPCGMDKNNTPYIDGWPVACLTFPFKLRSAPGFTCRTSSDSYCSGPIPDKTPCDLVRVIDSITEENPGYAHYTLPLALCRSDYYDDGTRTMTHDEARRDAHRAPSA
jgi:hypothetical protein